MNKSLRLDSEKIIFITGGARSGKSSFAMAEASKINGKKAYIATAEALIDGFISTAGALIAYCIEPKTKDYMFAAHNSVEIGHRAMLEKIGLQPILDLNLRLGEGTGAALAMLIIEAGLKIYKKMATFGEAGISKNE